MRTSLSLLILALLVGACGSDSTTPKVYNPDELRVQLVSGDDQAGQVASEAGASLSRIPGISMQALPPGLEVLDQPLVVQLVTESGQRVMGASVPSGMRAAWIVEEAGCGRPFHGDTDFDSEGRAENLWLVGTKAGVPCSMYAGRIVGGRVVIDSVFTAEFEPGLPVQIGWQYPEGLGTTVEPGTSLDLAEFARLSWDTHKNEIQPATLRAMEGLTVEWQWTDPNSDAEPITGDGWDTAVPDYEAAGFMYVPFDPNPDIWNPPGYRAHLTITIAGITSPPQVFRWDPHN